MDVLQADVELTVCFLSLPSMEESCSLTANREKLPGFFSLSFKGSHYISSCKPLIILRRESRAALLTQTADAVQILYQILPSYDFLWSAVTAAHGKANPFVIKDMQAGISTHTPRHTPAQPPPSSCITQAVSARLMEDLCALQSHPLGYPAAANQHRLTKTDKATLPAFHLLLCV